MKGQLPTKQELQRTAIDEKDTLIIPFALSKLSQMLNQ